MANESNKTAIRRTEHGYRIPANRDHYQQPSIKAEARRMVEERGMTMEQATEAVLSERREYARKLIEDTKARRDAITESRKQRVKKAKTDRSDPEQVAAMTAVRFESIDGPVAAHDRAKRTATLLLDPALVTRSDVERIAARKKSEAERAREQRIQLRDSLVLRADAFAAFVLIAENKGIPAHVIDERKLAAITTQKRWDLMPGVLSWVIREDPEVKVAFHAFCDAAKQCTENIRAGSSKASVQASEIISGKYREMFLQAASIYARKLSHLETSLDQLSTMSVADLDGLMQDGDDLFKRIAEISMKISDERKRREGKAGGDKANSTFRSLRAKVFVWLIDHYQDYKDRKALDEAASEIEKGKVVVGRSWRKIREDITEYGKLNQDEVQRYIAENLKLRTTSGE